MTLDPIALTQQLVRIASVTDSSNLEVSTAICKQLRDLRFDVVEHAYIDANNLEKMAISARRMPDNTNATGAGAGYFCHNDVVSVEGWNCAAGGPFDANLAGDRLWGRGACDMKGSAAAAIAAISRIDQKSQTAPLYYFVTGDEESGMLGADLLAQKSDYFQELAQNGGLGIIGEPTLLQAVLSHKGACHIEIQSSGVAAHSSTREGINANWQLIPMLAELEQLNARCQADPGLQNPAFDPPTLSLNLVIENKPHMANITVGTAMAKVFFRPMPGTAWESVADQIMESATKFGLQATLRRPLKPLHTDTERSQIQKFLNCIGTPGTGATPVSYATDGCCLSALKDLVVFGPGNIEQAHRPDEWISLDELRRGTDAFERIFRTFTAQ